jgi:hypothetical protein
MARDPRFEEFQWVLIYTREAHPGELVGAHATFADKLACAQRFQQRWQIQRTILVDDLAGSVHRAYGGLPNMTYIVAQSGHVVFRADWTDAHTLEWALTYLQHETREKASGQRVASFFAEIQGHRSAMDYPRVFLEGLLTTGGRRAADEYIAAVRDQRSPHQANRMEQILAELVR